MCERIAECFLELLHEFRPDTTMLQGEVDGKFNPLTPEPLTWLWVHCFGVPSGSADDFQDSDSFDLMDDLTEQAPTIKRNMKSKTKVENVARAVSSQAVGGGAHVSLVSDDLTAASEV